MHFTVTFWARMRTHHIVVENMKSNTTSKVNSLSGGLIGYMYAELTSLSDILIEHFNNNVVLYILLSVRRTALNQRVLKGRLVCHDLNTAFGSCRCELCVQ